MFIYILFIFLCLIMNSLPIRQKEKFNLIFISVILCLMMGLRSMYIGTDTYSYCREYLNLQYLGWKAIIPNKFVFGNFNLLHMVLMKLVSCIFPNSYTAYFLVVSAIVTVAAYKFIKEFSTDDMFSMLMLFALGFVFFFMSGIKQALAMAFVMLAYIQLHRQKTGRFILYVAVAMLFHNTAIIALLAIFADKIRFRRRYVIIAPAIILLGMIFQSQIFGLIQKLLPDGQYIGYGTEYLSSNNLTGLLIQCVIFAVCVILMWPQIEQDRRLGFYLWIYVIGMFFQSLTPVMAEFFRISMYFSMMGIVMLPHALEHTRALHREKPLIKAAVILVFVAYFFVSNYENTALVPYQFVWDCVL